MKSSQFSTEQIRPGQCPAQQGQQMGEVPTRGCKPSQVLSCVACCASGTPSTRNSDVSEYTKCQRRVATTSRYSPGTANVSDPPWLRRSSRSIRSPARPAWPSASSAANAFSTGP